MPPPLTALLAAAAVMLPVAPVSVATGDLDGDGSAELLALLYWPSWGSTARTISSSPGEIDLEVVPALRDRRELRAYRVQAGELTAACAPLEVGPELLGIATSARTAPVMALTRRGVSRVVLGDNGEGTQALRLVSVHEQETALGAVEGPVRQVPTAAVERGPWLLLPTTAGLTAVATDGTVRTWESPLREFSSGAVGGLALPRQRAVDVDRDGTLDRLDWRDRRARGGELPNPAKTRVAWQRGLGDGRFAPATIWDLGPLLKQSEEVENDQSRPELEDIIDLDGDGTLEAVISASDQQANSLGEVTRLLRGPPRPLAFHPLLPGGVIGSAGVRRCQVRGFPIGLPHPGGGFSSFRDLDGDGWLDYVTLVLQIGRFGLARAAITREARLAVQPLIFRGGREGVNEVADGAPEVSVQLDLSDGELGRFLDFPGDLDGDGRIDLVVSTGQDLQLHAGLSTGTFARQPSRRVPLPFAPQNDDALRFVDLDGVAPLEAIVIGAVETERKRTNEEDTTDPVRAARIAVISLGAAGR